MAKSGRRREQDRASADAKRAGRARVHAKAEHEERTPVSPGTWTDPGLSPGEVATLVERDCLDSPHAATVARMRLKAGIPHPEVAETARLLLERGAAAPAVGTLSFAAEVAHADGDKETEHRYTDEILARVEASGDSGLRVSVASSISGRGHSGEAIELIEPCLRDHPEDSHANLAYSFMLREAAEDAGAGDRERAALERFAGQSALLELKSAVMEFIGRTKWDGLIQKRAVRGLDLISTARLPKEAMEKCAAFALEAAVKACEDGIDGLPMMQLIELYKSGHRPPTVLTEFASCPDTPASLARRAADWAEYGHYGLWQLMYPDQNPGVMGTDVASGTRRYAAFPPGMLDGVPRWSAWLGALIPVDGIWRATGAGLMLDPAEADAVAESISKEVGRLQQTVSGLPYAEMLPPDPVPYGNAPPWGVRWETFTPPDGSYASGTSTALMTLGTIFMADIQARRARRAETGDTIMEPIPGSEAWLDEKLSALQGLTPREAEQGDLPSQLLLESLLRRFDYQADIAADPDQERAKVARLRDALVPEED